MKNKPYYLLKKPHHNRFMSALAISSLLFVVSGCDSIMKESKPTDIVANTASNPDNASLSDKNKNNSDYQAVSNDGFIAAADSASTSAGIMQVISANNQFTVDMYQQINGQPEQADKNVFFSPYSLSTAMAMLYAAAEGEIQKTFYYPSMDILNPNSAELYNQLTPELLLKGSIQSNVVAVLTNAVYFKGDWKMPFEANSTSLQPFYNHVGTSPNIKMMQLQENFGYNEDKQVQVVQLPYKGDDLSMLVVLPKSKDKASMQQLVQDLSADKIKQWNEDLITQEVNLYLPKFKLAERYDMKGLLSDMGMPSAF